MKKILILGGANLHCKLVRAAKEMGLYTVVTDYLVDSPAKKIADESWMLNVMDVDAIVQRCREEGIDAVLSTHLDPCQRPYYEICHKLGVPCYIDTWDQVFSLTDKNAFKAACIRNGVDIIPTYQETEADAIEYPVLVKPAHSRGSRGQTVCESALALDEALRKAKKESDDGIAIIEKYMGNKGDFSMTYIFVDGKPCLTRTSDRYLGSLALGLEKVGIGTVSPSHYTQMYIDNVEPRILKMLSDLHIKNGPVFMQGFVDGETVRFYDPGYRFPGSEFDEMYAKHTGIDLIKMMIEFAMTGNMNNRYHSLYDGMVKMDGHAAIVLFPVIRDGKIARVDGLDAISRLKGVYGYTTRHKVGEDVPFTKDVNQCFGEIDIICDSFTELKATLHEVFRLLHVIDSEGLDMLHGNIDVEAIKAPAASRRAENREEMRNGRCGN